LPFHLQPGTQDLCLGSVQSLFCTEPGPVLQPSTSKLGLGSVARSKLRSVASLPCLLLPRSLAPSLCMAAGKLHFGNGNWCDLHHTLLTCDDSKKILDDLTIRTVHGPAHRRRRDPAAALSGVLEQS